jgi:hypothetical protein
MASGRVYGSLYDFAVVHLSGMLASSRRATTRWTFRHEAPAPIDPKAQPATPGRSLDAAQAVTANEGHEFSHGPAGSRRRVFCCPRFQSLEH